MLNGSLLCLQRLLHRQCLCRGFVLEGFPATAAQALTVQQALETQKAPIEHAIFLEAPEEALIERCSGRLLHAASGRRYHDKSKPPLEAGFDDFTGEALTRPAHSDEQFDAGMQRYREDGGLVREFFSRAGLARDVDASGSASDVSAAIAAAVEGR